MPSYQLALFGSPRLAGDGPEVSAQVAFRHRLAVLAILSAAPGHTVTRARLTGLLWPEVDERRARHRLNVVIHELRKALGEDTLRSDGDSLRLDPERLRVDVIAFRAALAAGDLASAISFRSGPFLDGFYLDGAAEFERWVEGERGALDSLYRQTLETLARTAGVLEAPEWHRRLVESDPYNSRNVLEYMLALERAGDAPNALLTAQRHEEQLATDIGARTDPAFRDVVRRLREAPRSTVTPATPADRARDAVTERNEAPETPIPRQPRRPSRIMAGVGLLGLALLGLTLSRDRESPAPAAVLLVPLENLTGDSAYAQFGWVVADWISQGAGRANLPELIDPLLAFDAASDAAGITPVRIREVIERTGALAVLRGSIHRAGDSLRVVLRLTETQGGRVVAAIERAVPRAAFESALPGLEHAALGALAAHFDRRLDVIGTEGPSPTYLAYQRFVSGRAAFLRAEYAAAAEHFVAAAIQDSSFLGARVLAAQALYLSAQFRAADSLALRIEPMRSRLGPLDQHGLDWLRGTMKGDRIAAWRAARAAARLAPYSRWTVTFGEEAIRLNRPGEALAALSAVDADASWLGTWPAYHQVLARALHLLGRYEDELALVRRGRRPASNLIVQSISEARPLAALGRTAEIMRLVDAALGLPEQPNLTPGSLMQRAADELLAHGHVPAAQELWDRAIAYYEPIARDTTQPAVSLWALGNSLARAGRIDSAVGAYEALARRPRIARYRVYGFLGPLAARGRDRLRAAAYEDSLTLPIPGMNVFDASIRIYYRAIIAAQLGERDRAVRLLQEALAAGLPMTLDSLHIDPGLHPLRGHPAFDAMVRLDDPKGPVAAP